MNLGGNIDKFFKDKKNPTSQRSHLIQQVCDTLFDDTYFKRILGQTKKFTVGEIRAIYDEARSWDVNPQALFWKLVREKQNMIKEQLSEPLKDSMTE